MNNQLTPTEIQAVQNILKDYNPAQEALTILEKNQGKLDESFDQLWEEKTGVPTYGKKSL